MKTSDSSLLLKGLMLMAAFFSSARAEEVLVVYPNSGVAPKLVETDAAHLPEAGEGSALKDQVSILLAQNPDLAFNNYTSRAKNQASALARCNETLAESRYNTVECDVLGSCGNVHHHVVFCEILPPTVTDSKLSELAKNLASLVHAAANNITDRRGDERYKDMRLDPVYRVAVIENMLRFFPIDSRVVMVKRAFLPELARAIWTEIERWMFPLTVPYKILLDKITETGSALHPDFQGMLPEASGPSPGH